MFWFGKIKAFKLHKSRKHINEKEANNSSINLNQTINRHIGKVYTKAQSNNSNNKNYLLEGKELTFSGISGLEHSFEHAEESFLAYEQELSICCVHAYKIY